MEVSLIRKAPHIGVWEYQVTHDGQTWSLVFSVVSQRFYEFRINGRLQQVPGHPFVSREQALNAAIRYLERLAE